ncbi:hypothetical protein BVY01_02905 [bacterium I07]|nr:hypothetical protein BVY01_02905 [bacterium I07]
MGHEVKQIAVSDDILKLLQRIENHLENLNTFQPFWLTTDGLEQYTGLAKKTIYNYVNKRQIPFRKIPHSSKLIFNRADIDAWLNGEVISAPVKQEAKALADQLWEKLK